MVKLLQPVKHLVFGIKRKSGRNNSGKITVYHRGGGHKKRYRIIDFTRKLWSVSGLVVRVEYDPNRTARIALIFYRNGILSYILSPEGLRPGKFIETSNFASTSQLGNAMQLKFIPLGTIIYNIELAFGKGGQLVRSAGCYGKVVKKRLNYVLVRLSSGEERYVLGDALASIGRVSNVEHHLIAVGKAGKTRWLGIRPVTRACSMNPVDHPLGGRTRGGKIPVSAWGKVIGVKTVRKNNKFVVKKRVTREK